MRFITLYDGTLFDCQMIKNLLENEGIESFLKDEIIGSLNPVWRPEGSVKVMVADLEYDRAHQIVENYKKSQQAE